MWVDALNKAKVQPSLLTFSLKVLGSWGSPLSHKANLILQAAWDDGSRGPETPLASPPVTQAR